MTVFSLRRRLAAATASAAALAVVLAGCAAGGTPIAATSPTGEPIIGGTATVTLNTDPGTLDMAASTLQVTQFMGVEVFESLFALDADYVAQPMLIDAYEMSDDALTYTLTLRDGVTFHDGSALDAADVVASLERFLAVSAVGRLAAGAVTSVTAADDTTIVITLSAPRYGLISELAHPSAAIVPSETALAAGATPLTLEQSIGTGPYAVDAYTPGQTVTLSRFDEYVSRDEEEWGGYAGAKHAYLDALEYRFVSEDSTAVNGLTTGQWHVSMPSNDQYEVLSSTQGLTVAPSSGGVVNTVVLNHNEGSAFASLEARQALNLLLDKEALAAASGAAGDLLVEGGAFANPDNAPMYSDAGEDVYSKHDPEAAAELFAEAGIDTVRMLVPNTQPFAAWATVIQDELTGIGLNVELDSLDTATVRAKAAEEPGSWDLSLTFINGALSTPSQVNWLQSGYIGNYTNAELDGLLAAYDAAASAEEAKSAVDEVQAFVWDELPSIVIYGSRQYTATSASLQGFDNYALVLWNAWLDQ
ncbi:hypothetical protein JNB63_17695 [Microbacterium trichothecenolyticum]|uniref:ABC transporter substrate-binding protein n=1 Tax=Microbacterium trichothecenolyticum TaxID=69370 RepID=UPI001C6EA54C|nr:ABC transporter substrate-binding protein [Microbacterium trichothecenolyticum]MBW9121935.1 hypothetical protein [Microbacterium trichothecenolyticum]